MPYTAKYPASVGAVAETDTTAIARSIDAPEANPDRERHPSHGGSEKQDVTRPRHRTGRSAQPSQPMSPIFAIIRPEPGRRTSPGRSRSKIAADARTNDGHSGRRDHPAVGDRRISEPRRLQRRECWPPKRREDKAATPTDSGEVRRCEITEHREHHQAGDDVPRQDTDRRVPAYLSTWLRARPQTRGERRVTLRSPPRLLRHSNSG